MQVFAVFLHLILAGPAIFGFPINRPEEGTTHNKLDEVNVNQNVGVHQSMQTWKYVHYNLTDIGIVKSTNLELDNDYEYEISEGLKGIWRTIYATLVLTISIYIFYKGLEQIIKGIQSIYKARRMRVNQNTAAASA